MEHVIAQNAHSKLTIKEEGDQTIIHKSTDVSGALRHNELLRQAGQTKTKDGDHLAARIPIALLNQYALNKGLAGWQEVANDWKLLEAFMNDPDYNKCRIYEGQIS